MTRFSFDPGEMFSTDICNFYNLVSEDTGLYTCPGLQSECKLRSICVVAPHSYLSQTSLRTPSLTPLLS